MPKREEMIRRYEYSDDGEHWVLVLEITNAQLAAMTELSLAFMNAQLAAQMQAHKHFRCIGPYPADTPPPEA